VVRGGRRAGSIGSQQALGRGLTDPEELAVVVLGLADRIGRRARKKGRSGSTLTLRARFPGPRLHTRSHTLPSPTSSTAALAELGGVLLRRAIEGEIEPVTLVGMSLSNLTTDDYLQLELDIDPGDVLRAGSAVDLKRRALDNSVDEIRERFGRDLLKLGSAPDRGVTPEEFRRLAEHSD
jgi:DNA polymerase-4